MFRSRLHKLVWGLRTVGLRQTARGAWRMTALMIKRPDRANVRFRSGGLVEFLYPSQLVPALVMFGDVIDPELLLLRRILEPGAMLFDIGAAIGQFCVVAAQTPNIFIHAYEPSTANVKSLRRNLALNGLTENVEVHQAALSSTEGTTSFLTTDNAYLSGIVTDDATESIETVPMHTLVQELERLGVHHVDVLKVNVAGFENTVLTGALPVFASGRINVLIVLIGAAVVPVLAEIRDLGYRFFFFDPFRGILFEMDRVDQDTLARPPTPARHVVAIRGAALKRGALSSIAIRPLRNAGGHTA